MVDIKGVLFSGALTCGLFLPAKDRIGFSSGHPGEVLYKKYNCIGCHGSKGTRPFDLTDAAMDYTYDSLRSYIADPRKFGNTQMPVFRNVIPESDYKDLIDYVKMLRNNATKKNQ